jgi:transketolase
MRCLEQIRNGVCNMGLPVVVCGVGAGYAYGVNGATHHGVDDIAVMRALPGMTVVSPCDPRETSALLPALLELGGPAYLRLGRGREPVLPGTQASVEIGRPTVLREGREVALVATGGIASQALACTEMLVEDGVQPLVLSVHTLKPLGSLVDMLASRDIRVAMTVEEHGPHGGLFDALCSQAADQAWTARLLRASTPDRFLHESGSQESLLRRVGLDAASLASAVRRELGTLQ